MNLQKLLSDLIAERDALNAAIDVIRGRVTAHRPRQHAVMRTAAAAVARASTNGHDTAPARRKVGRPPGTKNKRRDVPPAYRAAGREIVAVPPPGNIDWSSVDFRHAVALAIQGVGQPIPTPELTLLLQTAGVQFPPAARKMPPRRYVGLTAGNLERSRVLKKTPEGWIPGKRALEA